MRHARGVVAAVAVAAALVGGSLWGAAPVAAQVLTGRILQDDDAAPVEAALVVLLSADSTRLTAVLSRAEGRYRIRLPEGDAFRLRVERLGYATLVTPVIERDRATRESVDVRLTVEAVSLEPIVVTGAGRCVVDPRTGVQTATLWDRARTALEVTALVQRDDLLRFRHLRFVRSLDPERSVFLGESLETGTGSQPFRSLAADRLAASGWVQSDREGSVFYMPDPEVALSGAFLDSHCFHVEERERPEGRQVGLAFAPLGGRRLPDIAGVLWLDEGTAELRSLEYAYTGLAHEEAMEVAGGRAEFEQLSNGMWIVRRWVISIPVLVDRRRFLGLVGGVEVARIREEGGQVVDARDGSGRRLLLDGPYEIVGAVRDGDTGRPLDGAVVRLSGTSREVTTGVDGGFRISGLARGEHLLTFMHPVLDTLAVRPGAWSVERPGPPDPVLLETPSRSEVLARACPDMEPEWTSSVLTGRVVDEATGEGAPDVRVELRFTGPRGRARAVDARTDAEGWYRLCAVMPDARLTLHAEDGEGRRGPEVTTRVEERSFGLVHLRIGG